MHRIRTCATDDIGPLGITQQILPARMPDSGTRIEV